MMPPTDAFSDDVKDEQKEGVWGYLLPVDQIYGKALVLKKRSACPKPSTMDELKEKAGKGEGSPLQIEEAYEETKFAGTASEGYLIGRHPECGK